MPGRTADRALNPPAPCAPAPRRPGAQGRHLLGHQHRQRAGAADLGHQQVGVQRALFGMGRVQARDDGLLDLRSGEARCRRGQRRQGEGLRVQVAGLQVDAQQLHPDVRLGQVDEEDFVEAALAQQFGRQVLDLVGGGHQEHRRLALGHPGQQVAQHPPRHPAVALARIGAHALFDLVDPQHARRQLVGRGQRGAQVLFGLAVVFGVQGAEIQAQQRYPEAAGDGLGQQRLAAALHAQQQHSARRRQARRRVAGERGCALADPALEPARTGHLIEAGGVVFVVQVAAAVEQLELQLRQLRQVRGGERAVGMDQLAGDPACVVQVQALQVAYDLAYRRLVGLDPAATMFTGVGHRLLADQFQQGVGIGQARGEAHRQRIQFGRQLDFGPDQHQHVRQAAAARCAPGGARWMDREPRAERCSRA